MLELQFFRGGIRRRVYVFPTCQLAQILQLTYQAIVGMLSMRVQSINPALCLQSTDAIWSAREILGSIAEEAID